MNIDQNHFEQQPTKCKSCKSFYGSEQFKGLCSSCFKKTETNTQNTLTLINDKPQIEALVQNEPITLVKQEQKVIYKQEAPKQIDRKKCFECRKKVGIMGNECKCGFVYCNSHRLPEQHSCSFNFCQAGKKKLEKELTKVYNGKITQI